MNDNSSRVLVALDNLRIHRRPLEIGAHLAAREKLPLTALFIENTALRHASELPFVEEIDRLSGALTPFEPARLERMQRRQIVQIQRWLVEIQVQLPFAGTLQILQGEYVTSVLEIAGDRDYLVFGTRQAFTRLHHRPPIWAWLDSSEEAGNVLALAEEFAHGENYPLYAAGPDAQSLPTLPDGRFTEMTPEAFTQLLRQQGCSAVFCSRASPLARRLPLIAPCPVLLV